MKNCEIKVLMFVITAKLRIQAETTVFKLTKSKRTNYNKNYKTQVVYLNLTSLHSSKVHNPLTEIWHLGLFKHLFLQIQIHSED